MEEFTSEPLCLSMEFIESAFASQKEALDIRYKYKTLTAKGKHREVKRNEALKQKKADNNLRVKVLESEILAIHLDLESYQAKQKEINELTKTLVSCAMRANPIPDDIMQKCREEINKASSIKEQSEG
jgi:hypothetical protein